MTNPITGLVQVTGGHDVGKTTFALTSGARASETVFIDSDIKGRSIVNQIGQNNFAMYCDFIKQTAGLRELDVHEYGLRMIEEITKLHPKVIVWDTWTAYGKTCHPYVAKYPHKFREFWSAMGQIKGGEQWQAAFAYEAQIIEKLLAAAPLVFLATHLKDHRIGQIKTGKQIPDAQKTLEEKSNFRVWLHHNPDGAEPIGLVLKRIERMTDTTDGLVPTNVLPRKLKPCTWKQILYYWDNPIGNRAPTTEETPDEFELSILDGTLTADQKEVFRAGMLSPEPTDLGIVEVEDKKDKVMELIKEGKTKPQVAAELGITVARVISLSKENGNG